MKIKTKIVSLLFCFSLTTLAFSQTCSDGIQNGTETGIDCGGTCPPCVATCQITLVAETTPVQGGCCTYVLEMVDSFGDGWNGASMSVVVNGTTFGPYSATGSGTNVNIPVCNGQTIQINYLAAGSWPSECSYSLNDGEGNVVYQAGPSPAVGNNVFSGTGICYNPGSVGCTGGDVILSVNGGGSTIMGMDNDFDSGSAGNGWSSNVQASFNNPCGPSVDGGAYMWMGSSAQHPRIIATVPLDLSCADEICFYLDFATQGDASPCEGIDLADEGVYFEYSLDGGVSWITVEYFGPAGVGNSTTGGGTNPQMTSWNEYCYLIPAVAQTTSTMFHWAQTGSSGSGNDHWGLDNVTISTSGGCVPYWYDYDHLLPSNDNPTQSATITSDTTFNVIYTNGTVSCSSSVSIILPPCPCPDATVSGGGNYCAGNDIPNVVFTVLVGTNPITLVYAIDGVNQPPLVFNIGDSIFTDPTEGTYTIVSVTDPSLCVGTFSGTAEVFAFPAPELTSFTGEGTYCAGDAISNLTVNATGTGTLSIDYTLDGVAQTAVTGTSPLILGNAPGIYELTQLSDDGCTTPVTGTQTIVVNPIPTATAGTTTSTICAGEDIVLTCNTSTGTYDWSGPNNFTSTLEDPTITSAQSNTAGTYSVMITENGCTSPPSTVDITVNAIPNVTANLDQTICIGTSLTLTGSGATSYSWDNGITNNVSFIPGATQTYTVTGTSNGCTNTASVTITVLSLPIADGSSSINSGYAPLPVTFINNSLNATSYVWEFGNGNTLPTNSLNSVNTTYNTPGTYYIILTASNGICSDTWTDSVIVISYPALEIHVPNVFSPNNDGSNDVYFIEVVNGKSFEATIVNRWGNVVHTIDTLNTGWDGKINGNPASDGVYFIKYVVEGLDETTQEGHTYFHLVR